MMINDDNGFVWSWLYYTSKIQSLIINSATLGITRIFMDVLILTRYSTKNCRWFGTMWPFDPFSFCWLRICLFSTLTWVDIPNWLSHGSCCKNSLLLPQNHGAARYWKWHIWRVRIPFRTVAWKHLKPFSSPWQEIDFSCMTSSTSNKEVTQLGMDWNCNGRSGWKLHSRNSRNWSKGQFTGPSYVWSNIGFCFFGLPTGIFFGNFLVIDGLEPQRSVAGRLSSFARTTWWPSGQS